MRSPSSRKRQGTCQSAQRNDQNHNVAQPWRSSLHGGATPWHQARELGSHTQAPMLCSRVQSLGNNTNYHTCLASRSSRFRQIAGRKKSRKIIDCKRDTGEPSQRSRKAHSTKPTEPRRARSKPDQSQSINSKPDVKQERCRHSDV